uniref:Fibronectin type-III domain-containing protein n=1 Tax=Angiostrongylus cantonensis TaxID=6313 RepID=A0A0K0DB58_ANGCA
MLSFSARLTPFDFLRFDVPAVDVRYQLFARQATAGGSMRSPWSELVAIPSVRPSLSRDLCALAFRVLIPSCPPVAVCNPLVSYSKGGLIDFPLDVSLLVLFRIAP